MVAIARPLAVRPNLPTGLGYSTGDWYGPAVPGAVFASLNATLNTDIFAPFLCRKTTTFDRIAIYNTGAVTQNIRLGIYQDNGGGRPGALIVDAGQVTTSGAAGDNAATISQSLTGGVLYWLAMNPDATIAVQGLTPATSGIAEGMMDFALPAASTFGVGMATVVNSRAYGAYPNPADAIDGVITTIPFIRLRAA